MRGKAGSAADGVDHTGITPAYAGKRSCAANMRQLVKDHPRLCGEKRCRSRHCVTVQGSPPPMRGKVNLMVLTVTALGITPAYAGKRDCHRSQVHRWRDHPRLCGEKSPFCVCLISRGGITPAYAGKSHTRSTGTVPDRDHPRLCGEKAYAGANTNRWIGSPPPMRGKGQLFCHLWRFIRITPAYAGKRIIV